MQDKTYTAPQVRDYGTLLEVTSALDVSFLGGAQSLVMAAISNPFSGGVDGVDSSYSDGGGGAILGVEEIRTHGAAGGSGGAGGGKGGGGALKAAGGGGGGKHLPFTGLPVILLAAVGATLASAGAVLRSLVRRRPDDAT
jgi:hypothetical protein